MLRHITSSKDLRKLGPRVINTDKNPAYDDAILELKKEGVVPKALEHRQLKYLNNRLENDHGKLKRLIRPTLGFQSMRTARASIKGFEVMRMFKKGQFKSWIEAVGGGNEVPSSTACLASTSELGYGVGPLRRSCRGVGGKWLRRRRFEGIASVVRWTTLRPKIQSTTTVH